MNWYARTLIFYLLMFLYFSSFAQTDSLFLKNNELLVGEIKSMVKGVVTIKTYFSKDDLRIKWIEVNKVYSRTPYLISTKKGIRYYGSLITSEYGSVSIKQENMEPIVLDIGDIVELDIIKNGLLNRLSAQIDMGYTMAKARNQRQLSLRSRIGYMTKKWTLDASMNVLLSVQDDTEPIGRFDAHLTYNYLLNKDWFIVGRRDLLSNTEQKLDLRTNTKLGIGKFVIRNNSMYWNFSAGASYNKERFEGGAEERQSAESWFGTEINLFDSGDINLFSNAYVYPSLTEKGRVRLDYKIDLKYNLPLNFYIRTGLTWNYDNQPTPGGTTHDYVWQTTFGWSL